MRVLSVKQVSDLTSLSRATIYRKNDPDDDSYDETFPKPFSLSDLKVCKKGKRAGMNQVWCRRGYLEAEVLDWIAKRASKRSSS